MANWCYNSCDVSGPEKVVNEFFRQMKSLEGIQRKSLSSHALTTKGDLAHLSAVEKANTKAWLKQNKLRLEGYMHSLHVDEDNNTLAWDTKWSPDEDLLQSMSASFPELSFRTGWDEPGNDCGGYYLYEGGECVGQDSGPSESNGGVYPTYVSYILAAATLPMSEVLNLTTLNWEFEEREIDDVTTDITPLHKVFTWVIERGSGIPTDKKKRTKKLLKELAGLAGFSFRPNWTDTNDTGFRDLDQVMSLWGSMTAKQLRKYQEDFRLFVEEEIINA